jgi:hypothetical protein
VELANAIVTNSLNSPISLASIANTFAGNTIQGNYGGGVLFANAIGTAGGTSPVTTASIANTFTGNDISGNLSGDGVGSLGIMEEVSGNVIGALGAGSAVSGASITNSFADNTIDGNEGNGVYLGNDSGHSYSIPVTTAVSRHGFNEFVNNR